MKHIRTMGISIVLLGLFVLISCSENPPVVEKNETEKPILVPEKKVQSSNTPKPRKEIYDPTANAKQVIADAISKAKKEDKNILVIWGGNWCGWCHILNDLFENNNEINTVLNEKYIRVPIDSRINKRLIEEMKVQTEGVPYLTLLDANGKKIKDQSTVPFEVGSKHDPKKVLAFLKKHTVKSLKTDTASNQNAETQLSNALANLTRDDQRLIVKFSSTSCGWCKRLDSFLASEKVKPILDKDYASIEIMQNQVDGATELRNRLSKGISNGGVPWFAILDKDGNILTNTNGPQGNIGYPAEPEGIVHFMNMLTQTLSTIERKELGTIETELKALSKLYGY